MSEWIQDQKTNKCVSGQTVPPILMRPCLFFLISEIPDGEKRSEMVVNLILRYEKINGT
jgi:hypothetical protein